MHRRCFPTHLQIKIVLTLVLVIRKLQGYVVLDKWLSSNQESIQDQDLREIYRQMKIVLTLVLVIRKLQGCVVLNKWLSSVQDSIQDQDLREIYRQGKITLADKGCLEHSVHLLRKISSGYNLCHR